MALPVGKDGLALEASSGSQSKEEVDWDAPLSMDAPAGAAAGAAAPDQRIAQDALSLAEDASAVRQGKCKLPSICMQRAHQASPYG